MIIHLVGREAERRRGICSAGTGGYREQQSERQRRQHEPQGNTNSLIFSCKHSSSLYPVWRILGAHTINQSYGLSR